MNSSIAQFGELSDSDRAFAAVTVFFEIFIIVPILCYSCIQYNRHLTYTCIAKRRPRPVIMNVIASILFIIVNIGHIIFGIGLFCNRWFELVIFFAYPPIFHAVFYSILLRFWLLYFDIHWSIDCQGSKWKVECLYVLVQVLYFCNLYVFRNTSTNN